MWTVQLETLAHVNNAKRAVSTLAKHAYVSIIAQEEEPQSDLGF